MLFDNINGKPMRVHEDAEEAIRAARLHRNIGTVEITVLGEQISIPVDVLYTPEEEVATRAEWAENARLSAIQQHNAPLLQQIAANEAAFGPLRDRALAGIATKDEQNQMAALLTASDVLRAQLQ